MPTPNIVFTESFRGYRMDAAGYHDGPSLPLRDSDKLQAWIKNNVERFHELRVTDGDDFIVMQIINQTVVFPKDTGLVWDPKIHDWALRIPTEPTEPTCIKCKQPFTDKNVHTELGWKETRISRLCEDCFDAIFAGPNDDDDDDSNGNTHFVDTDHDGNGVLP